MTIATKDRATHVFIAGHLQPCNGIQPLCQRRVLRSDRILACVPSTASVPGSVFTVIWNFLPVMPSRLDVDAVTVIGALGSA
jgi:hypothetical protein